MRERRLNKSVESQLGDGSQVSSSAVLIGFGQGYWFLRLGVGLAVAAIAMVAGASGLDALTLALAFIVAVSLAPPRFILADTSQGLMLLNCSRIRASATGVVGPVSGWDQVERVGGGPFWGEWRIQDRVYTVDKRQDRKLHQGQTMNRSPARPSGGAPSETE